MSTSGRRGVMAALAGIGVLLTVLRCADAVWQWSAMRMRFDQATGELRSLELPGGTVLLVLEVACLLAVIALVLAVSRGGTGPGAVAPFLLVAGALPLAALRLWVSALGFGWLASSLSGDVYVPGTGWRIGVVVVGALVLTVLYGAGLRGLSQSWRAVAAD